MPTPPAIPTPDGPTRTERDSLGEVEVPADALYGIATQRAISNFPISGTRLPAEMVWAVATIKLAAARTHRAAGHLDAERAAAIEAAAQEVASGRHADQFPLDAYQAGAGTSFHMNVNEVVASLAAERLGGRRGVWDRVHPNDHVNLGQSTNDVFPTAMRLASLRLLEPLDAALDGLAAALRERATAFDGVVKAGRTHLQDAVPLRLGQEVGAWATAVARAREAVAATRPALLRLGLGGTAAGTGLNTSPSYRPAVVRELAALTGWEVVADPDPFAAMQSMAPFTALSGALRNLAVELVRVSSDLRLLASGPSTGLAELVLPAVQPGSSIMPGKVNPSIAEMVGMVGFRVLGADATVAAASQAGQLELNVFMPVIASELMHALRILASASQVLADRCVRGLEAEAERCRGYAEASLALATVLNPVIGYAKAAEVAKEAYRRGLSVPEVVRERGLLGPGEHDRVFAPEALTSPNLPESGA